MKMSYRDIFSEDLGDHIFTHVFPNSINASANIWPPILSEDGTWGCKIISYEDGRQLVSVMPGSTCLESLLRGIDFIYSLEKKYGNPVPKIDFFYSS